MNKAIEYGHALYELAAEEGLEKEIEQEFSDITLLFENNDNLINLLSNPRIPSSERIEVLVDIFGKQIHSFLLSTLKIFTENREVSLIPLCFREYQKNYYQDKNILLVTAISQVELNDNQKQKIISKLADKMNKTIILKNEIDETCIGGIRLEYHGNMIDASIKSRFEKLQHDLKNADYSQAEV